MELMDFVLDSETLDATTSLALMHFLQTLYRSTGGDGEMPSMGQRTQKDGTPCIFPVEFDGVRYTDCVPYLGSFYCADSNQDWAECDL